MDLEFICYLNLYVPQKIQMYKVHLMAKPLYKTNNKFSEIEDDITYQQNNLQIAIDINNDMRQR